MSVLRTGNIYDVVFTAMPKWTRDLYTHFPSNCVCLFAVYLVVNNIANVMGGGGERNKRHCGGVQTRHVERWETQKGKPRETRRYHLRIRPKRLINIHVRIRRLSYMFCSPAPPPRRLLCLQNTRFFQQDRPNPCIQNTFTGTEVAIFFEC